MRKGVLVTALVVVVALAIPALSAADSYSCYGCPPELVDQTFPEPRAYIETQGWWIQGQTALTAPDISNDPLSDFAFTSTHVHLGISFPLGERMVLPDSGGYSWPYLAQAHENIGGKVRGVRGGGFTGIGGGDGLTYDEDIPHVTFDTVNWRYAGAIEHPQSRVEDWRNAAPGNYQNRFTFDTTSKFGKRQYQSGAWNAFLNAPGQPVAVTARGWYDGPGYTNVTMKTKAQAHMLADGSWYAPGKIVNYGLAQGATRAFAYIDADIHHGSKGIVLIENKTGSSGSFGLPDLAPGDHTLLLGGWEKTSAGWNAGVLRLPFHVNEPPPASGSRSVRGPKTVCRMRHGGSCP